MVEAFGPVLTSIPGAARLTLTWDQGSEMARHDLLDAHFAEGIDLAVDNSGRALRHLSSMPAA